MKKVASTIIDTKDLTPLERKRLERALHPRDSVFSLRYNKADIDLWREAALSDGLSITDWVKQALDRAAGRR